MNRLVNRVVEVYVFAFTFLIGSRPISDADFWFHLKTGEYVYTTGIIPRTELFSFTHFGQAWVAHGWLSGTFFYAIYSWLGFNALIFLFALLTAVAFWIAFRRCNSHPLIAALATLLGVWSVMPNIGVRPRVFTLLFASIYLALLGRFKRDTTVREIWLLVPLMLLWANLHGGFLIGLALIMLTMIGMILDAWALGTEIRQSWPRLRVLALVLLCCLVVALLNPYGLRIYTFPLQVLSSPVFQESVLDWLSPNFHQPELMPLALLMLATIGALALSPRRVRPSDLLFFLATLYATLKANRNMIIFALVIVPIFAERLQNWLDSSPVGTFFKHTEAPKKGRQPVIVTALLLVPLLAFIPKLRSEVYAPLSQKRNKVPIGAVEFLKQKNITGNTFTYPSIWGGYLIWALPTNPVYIDGRDVYPEQFVKDFLEIVNGITDWRPAFDRYSVKVVIVKPKTLLARELQESANWQLLYHDEISKVFGRR